MFTAFDELDLIEAPAKCECGADLPWHLVRHGCKGYSHQCGCGLHYRWRDGGLVCDGNNKPRGLKKLVVVR